MTTVIANSIGASISGFNCVPTREIRNKFFKVKRFEDETFENYIFYHVM